MTIMGTAGSRLPGVPRHYRSGTVWHDYWSDQWRDGMYARTAYHQFTSGLGAE